MMSKYNKNATPLVLQTAVLVSSMLFAGCSFSTETVEVATCMERKVELTRNQGIMNLPERSGPQTVTSGRVPHVQIGETKNSAITDELHRLTFSIPGLEMRPTIASLPGTTGIWLQDDMPVAHPTAIVAGREFAHIHTDGSLHAALPFNRASEVTEKKWGERHPWADQNPGWEGFVMLYSPRTMDEVDIVFELITESYNHITGQSFVLPDC